MPQSSSANAEVPQDAQAPAAAKNVKRNLKKKVSPDEFGGPKRTQSGYMLFGNEVRPAIQAKLQEAAKAEGKSKSHCFRVLDLVLEIVSNRINDDSLLV